MPPPSFPLVVFTRPGQAELLTDPPAGWCGDDAGAPFIETEYSLISAGTELANRDAVLGAAHLPCVPGYGSVGRVLDGARAGERVFTYGRHAKFSPEKVAVVPLPAGLDPVKAVFARMAAVSITSLRVADAALGDWVAVFGLGLVGNFAAQLFTLAGCEVIAIDPAARRREEAAACGIEHTLAPGDDLQERVAALTDGRLCHSVVEATGVPAVARTAGALAAQRGELILLGSPRGRLEADLVPFLNQMHAYTGGITVKGAHEWQFPYLEAPANHNQGHWRFSMAGNVRALLRLIARGKLKVDPLLTHVASPADCQAVYDGLRDRKDDYLGVVFDWSKV